MKIQHLQFYFFIAILFLFSSCYKEDIHIISNAGISNTFENINAEMYIAERQSVFCKEYDALGNYNLVEYNLSTKTKTTQNYILPNVSYWAKTQNEIYTAKEDVINNRVNIYNMLTGSIVETINYPYFVNTACIANGKIFVSEGTLSNNLLHVYDATSKVELSQTYVGIGDENIAVSADGSRIYTSKENSCNTYSVSLTNNSLNYQYMKILYPFNFTQNTYSLSKDGSVFVTDEGKVYNNKLENLILLNNGSFYPYRKLYISSDGKKIIAMSDYTITVYDASSFQQLSNYRLEFDTSWKYNACFPYFINGEFHIVANIANSTSKRMLIY